MTISPIVRFKPDKYETLWTFRRWKKSVFNVVFFGNGSENKFSYAMYKTSPLKKKKEKYINSMYQQESLTVFFLSNSKSVWFILNTWKIETAINFMRYIEKLKRLWKQKNLQLVRPYSNEISIHQNKERPHCSRAKMEAIKSIGFQFISHLLYDWVQRDIVFLYLKLKKNTSKK